MLRREENTVWLLRMDRLLPCLCTESSSCEGDVRSHFIQRFLPSLPPIFLPIIDFCQLVIMFLSSGLAAVLISSITPFPPLLAVSPILCVFSTFPIFI